MSSSAIYEFDESGRCTAAPDLNAFDQHRNSASVGLRGGWRACLPADRVALGYIASLDDRPRYVLDAGTHRHSTGRDCAGAVVRCDCPEDNLSRNSASARRLRFVLGPARATG